MSSTPQQFVREIFRERHHANVHPTYLRWRSVTAETGRFLAVLGYRDAGDGRLFLEHYLDQPVEEAIFAQFGLRVSRAEIVEIGCLAACSAPALIQLWHSTATLLDGNYRVAVATLTASVRRPLQRLGLPMIEIGKAEEARLPDTAEEWGKYYADQPTVCAGLITDGARALAATPVTARCAR